MNGVSEVSVLGNVALVTFHRIPADLSLAAEVFELFSSQNINVDMISQTAAQGFFCSLSFTIPGESVTHALETVAQCTRRHQGLHPMISTGFCKISLFGEEMREACGVAARALRTLHSADIAARMISTSETDISILISEADEPPALSALRTAFSLPPA